MKPRTVKLPTEAMIAVNLQCNARCVMCGIWRLKERGTLTAADYANLPDTLERVGITGGEPFMRDDIAALIRAIHVAAGAPQIVVSTNGYLTSRILSTVEALDDLRPRIGFGISVDGIGPTHDRIRGTRHAFEKALRTIDALKRAGVGNLRISFTILNDNVDEMPAVYELSRELGIEFCSQVAHNSQLYYRTASNTAVDPAKLKRSIARINERELASFTPKPWFRAYFNSGIVEHNEHARRLVDCDALDRFFYLSPHGDVYPCLFVQSPVGNITQQSFESLWLDERRRRVRHDVSGCESCWLMCTSRTGLIHKAHAAVGWVVKEQARRAFAAGRRLSTSRA